MVFIFCELNGVQFKGGGDVVEPENPGQGGDVVEPENPGENEDPKDPETPRVEETVTISFADYASTNNWVNGTKYSSFSLDSNILVSASEGTNNGKYYSSGNNWRLYQSDKGTLTISASNGKTIKVLKITYNQENGGTLVLDGNNIASKTVVEVNGNTITFSINSTTGKANGQVKVTAIEVVYE